MKNLEEIKSKIASETGCKDWAHCHDYHLSNDSSENLVNEVAVQYSNQFKDELSSAQSEIARLTEENSKLTDKITVAGADIFKLTSEKEELETSISMHQTRFEELKTEATRKDEEIADLRIEVERLKYTP